MKPKNEEIESAIEAINAEIETCTNINTERALVYIDDLKTILAALESAQAMIDLTYKEWCGRDYMHLPLNEAVGARIAAAIDAARKSQ